MNETIRVSWAGVDFNRDLNKKVKLVGNLHHGYYQDRTNRYCRLDTHDKKFGLHYTWAVVYAPRGTPEKDFREVVTNVVQLCRIKYGEPA